jgi:colanic acid biosynthesis glycosyl transferase WcaI
MLHRALAYLSYLAHASIVLLTMRKPDLTFGVTHPSFLAQLLDLTSRLRGLRYQYMLLDMYPESLAALRLPTIPLLTRLWRSSNRLSYHRAERIIVLGPDMLPRLAAYQLPPARIVYLPHWSAFETLAPLPVEASTTVGRLGLKDKFIVQYSGNMGLLHDMIPFVRAAAALRSDPSIHFVFVGGGTRRTEVEALSTELGLENVTWRDFVPLEQLGESLASCHLSLISLRQVLSGIAVPCKLYGILASGRAVLAQVPADSEVALTVDENACGLVVAPSDVDGLVASIRSLAADRERTRRMANAPSPPIELSTRRRRQCTHSCGCGSCLP